MAWLIKQPPVPGHLRVPWGVRDALIVFLGGWIVLPVLVVVLLRLTAPFDPLAATIMNSLRSGGVGASFGLALIDAVGALLLVWYYLRRYGASWTTAGWRQVNWLKAAGYLLGAFIIFALLIGPLLQLIALLNPGFQPDQPQQNEFVGAANNHRLLALIALVVLPPIVEETVFRGFIFPAIAKRWGFWVGAIASSILFGFAHLQANVSVYTFVLGILLCFMYVRLRSIIPGIGLHMLNNYLAFVALTSGR